MTVCARSRLRCRLHLAPIAQWNKAPTLATIANIPEAVGHASESEDTVRVWVY